MALSDNGWKGNILTGLAIGVGAALLTPSIRSLLAEAGKPLAKAAVKGGLMLFEKGREVFAEVGEHFEDIVAEVKHEMSEEESKAAVHPAEESGGNGGQA